MTKRNKSVFSLNGGTLHHLKESEIEKIQKSLLRWYYLKQRVLPWRSIAASEEDGNKRAYAVWVSEIMLQQTQVATVVNYFNEWISKWSTVDFLAQATLEEVNKTWAGLGYYSRAKRLHEGAVKISKDLNGEFPQDRENLQKVLPGVGRYTASAIASIAMKEPVGVVDGNVLRVLARVRAIGGDISSQAVVEEFWKLADQLVDREEPGDFNQAIMELGATVCTPKNPSCSTCPVKDWCIAFAQTEHRALKHSLAEALNKGKRDWKAILGDIECGLLANLWEFISVSLSKDENEGKKTLNLKTTKSESFMREILRSKLKEDYRLSNKLMKNLSFVSDVTHMFSHIRQTYKVYEVDVEENIDVSLPESYQGSKWMTEDEFLSSATSTAMKKVFKAYKSSFNTENKMEEGRRKRSSTSKPANDKKQRKLSHFFSPVQIQKSK